MNVSIYIENYKLDTNEDTIVALTMCYSYVEDPTTIAGDYSKSITVPGTVNNNMIFGQFWNIDRRFLESDDDSNSGVYFNASKRTPAKIYLGNDIFKSGYVQLNAVNKTQGKLTYEITFYSELCNMLHTIMDSSLSALKFPGSLAHTINTNAINDNVNGNGPRIIGSASDLSDFVHYGLSNDGVFDNFNSSKWLTFDSANDKWVVADIDSNGTNYDTAMILQSPANRVRPYIKISSLLNQIRDDYNQSNDTLLEYSDPYFFNSTNPYVCNTVMSCKVYDTENSSTSFSNIYFDDFEVPFAGVANAIVLKAKGSDLVTENGYMDLSSLTVIPRIEIECMLAFDGSLNASNYNTAVKNAVYSEGRQFTSTGSILPRFTLQRLDSSGNVVESKEMSIEPIYPGFGDRIFCNQQKDEHNTVISPYLFESRLGTPTFELAFKNCVFNRVEAKLDCNETPCTYKEVPIYDKRYTNLSTGPLTADIMDVITDNNDGIGVTDFFPFKFYYGNLTPGLWRLRVHVSPNNLILHIRDCADYSFGDSLVDIKYTNIRMRGRFNTKIGYNSLPASNSNFIYRNCQPLQVYLANNLENTTVTNTTGLPLSMTTSTGNSTGSMVSFSDMVDSDTTQGDFLVNYTKLFGLVYDSDTVNTDNIIRVKTRDYYHQDYKILDWTDKIDYSQTFKHDPLSFNTKYLSLNYNPSESYYAKKYANTFDTSYGVQLIDTGYEFNSDTSTLIENQLFNQCIMVKGESRFKGICPGFFDKNDNSRSPIDGHYSLLFWNTDRSDCYKQPLFIYDDCETMHDTSVGGEETMCFVDTSALAGGGIQLYGRNIDVPAPNSLRDSFSTDLGYPRSNYADWNVGTYPSSGTIFNQFWNTYIKDLYNANTQIITAYVHLSPLEIMKFSFKNFVKIKDTLWHPNKIEDYNPLSTKPVSVELVKVNDINAYTNAQMKFYEYFRAEFNVYTNDSTIPASNILTPVAGGIITGSSTNQYYGNFRYGVKWSQSFTTVGVYTKVSSIEAYYFDSDGNRIDCSDWFDIYTYTFTCKDIPTSDVTVNIDMDENVVYHSIGVELDNAQVTWIEPAIEVTRLKDGDSLKLSFSVKDGLSSDYKLAYATVEMDAVDISDTTVDIVNRTITIDKVTGDIVILITYAEFNDILLPWVKVTNTSDNVGWLDILGGDCTLLTFGAYGNPNDSSIGVYSTYKHQELSTYTHALMLNNKNMYRLTNGPKSTYTFTPTQVTVDNPATCTFTYANDSYKDSNWKYQGYNYDYSKDSLDSRIGWSVFEHDGIPVKGNAYVPLYNPLFFHYYNQTAVNTLVFRFAETRYENYSYAQRVSIPRSRIIPLLHYEDSVYKVKFYDSYSKKYLDLTVDSNSNKPEISYDTTSSLDIPLQWIGNNINSPGSFDIGESDTSTGLVMYFYTTELNKNTYLVSSNSSQLEYTTSSGETLRNNCANYIMLNSNGITANYGMYVNEGTRNTLEQYEFIISSTYNYMNSNIRIAWLRNYGSRVTLGLGSNLSVGNQETIVANQSSSMYLFKQPDTESYSTNVRLLYLKVLNGKDTKRYYTPVLHFTGDKNQYISKEGIKIPLGYTPCLYESVNQEYVYLSTGNPSFGFKHNS